MVFVVINYAVFLFNIPIPLLSPRKQKVYYDMGIKMGFKVLSKKVSLDVMMIEYGSSVKPQHQK